MYTESSTLHIGDKAPDFLLSAANQPGVFSLEQLRSNGPVALEFLRGTW